MNMLQKQKNKDAKRLIHVEKEMSRVLLTSCGLRFGGYIGRHECLSASDIYGQS